MLTLKSRLIAPLLFLTTAVCGLALSACQDVPAPGDDPATCEDEACLDAQYAGPNLEDHEDLEIMEGRDARARSLDDVSEIRAGAEALDVEQEPVSALADQCTISGFPKPWGGADWGPARVELWSDQAETCFYSRVTNTSSTSLCAWVDHPLFGQSGKRCTTGTSVTSYKVPAFGMPGGAFEAWGTVSSPYLFIWYLP